MHHAMADDGGGRRTCYLLSTVLQSPDPETETSKQ